MSNQAIIGISILSVFVISAIVLAIVFKNNRKSIRYHIELYNKRGNADKLLKGKSHRQANRGIMGEQSIENIISKYTNHYYRDVPIPARKKDFFTEMDFIIPTNKEIILVEVKAWYGKISKESGNFNKVVVDLVNHYGKHVVHERDDPHMTVSCYANDFLSYMKKIRDVDINKDTIKKIIVFSRDETDFSKLKEYYEGKTTMFFNKRELDSYLISLKQNNEFDRPLFDIELPSWDKVYCANNDSWTSIIVLNKTFNFKEKSEPASSIHGIMFTDTTTDNCKVLYHNGKVEHLHLDYRSIQIYQNVEIRRERNYFFVLNKELHDISKA